jgi:hypothetical protein
VIDIPFQFNDSLFPSLSLPHKLNKPKQTIDVDTTDTDRQNNIGDYLNELKKTPIRGIKKQKIVVSSTIEPQPSSLTVKYDFTPVLKMWQKRKEDYIELYGVNIYEKMFIFPDKIYIYNEYDMDMDVEDKLKQQEEYENYDEIYDVYY